METRWLDADEQRIWRTFMIGTTQLIDQLDRELQQAASMPAAYYEVLVRLSEAPDRALRMSELAGKRQVSRSRLSHTIARLEEAGYVRRESCPSDRRGAYAVLTDEGFRALEAAAPAHVEGVRTHLFDQLTKSQLEELGVIGSRLIQHLVAIGNISPQTAQELVGGQ